MTFLGGTKNNYGTVETWGVYLLDGSTVQRVADQATLFPGTAEFFAGFTRPSLEGSTVVFSGFTADHSRFGLLKFDGTGLSLLLDDRSQVPIGKGFFEIFQTSALSDGAVWFRSQNQGDPTYGLYKLLDGEVVEVIASGRELDGRTIEVVSFGDDPSSRGNGMVSQGSVVFRVWFTDGSKGIYIAASPPLTCSGFEAPLAGGPVTVRGSRALPIRAQVLASDGRLITDSDLIFSPVLQVWYEFGTPAATDVSAESLPAGHSTEGNQFFFDTDQSWHYNLRIKNYSAPGIYTVFMDSGNPSEYLVEPTCTGQFVIE